MKTRVISSLVGLVILAVVLVLIGTKVLNLVIAALSLIALHEMLRATGCIKSRGLAVLSYATALTVPFAREPVVWQWVAQLIFLFFILFFVILIKNSTTVRVDQAALVFLFSLFIPLFFSCAVFMRDLYGPVAGAFYLLMALGSAWLCDTGAYFAGRAFGRHKLAPVVSPNKTVEGAIGGIISCVVFMLLLALGFSAVVSALGFAVRINYPMLILLTPVCAVLGMMGDLSASVIKRQYHVKDYGNIMPGHGGVMDRFDSALFTLPGVFIISLHVQIITVL